MIIVLVLAVSTVAGWFVARRAGHPVQGALSGLLLGPLGVALAALYYRRPRP